MAVGSCFVWTLMGMLAVLCEATEETVAAPVKDEPMFGVLDIVLIVALLGIAGWWLFKRKDDSSSKPVYTIQPTTLGAPSQQTGENSFIKKLKSSGRSLVAFYGSQTGTGEEFAGRIAKEGIRYHLKGMVADPEEYEMGELINMKDIPNSLAVFCLATYGEGDPTDNAMDFYEWLQNGEADLTGLNYAVFGLGNKTYEHYNAVAIYVDKRLEELGATRVFQLGLGDDDANIEDDFITWKDKFWPAVCEHFGMEATGEEVSVRQYQLTEHPEINPERVYTGEVARLHSLTNQRPPYDMKNPFLAPVRVNRELHKSGDRSCMHIEFDINGSKMRYDTGDHVAVYPENDATLVARLGKLLDADLDTIFTLTNTDEDSSKKHPFPCPTSYRTALTYYIDITSNPRTHILKELSEYAQDPKEKEQLRLMASTSPEGKQLYNQWIIQDNRNILHILEDMPSVKPEIDHLCELLPRLQCRYYSISSSSKLYPTTVHITAVKVEYTTPTNRLNKGVATCWLSNKIPPVDDGSPPMVPIFIRKSQFKLPTRMQTPILMIGPGTGLAPFRGFIQERDLARRDGKPVGNTILYFGCRKKAEDFLYQEELEGYEKTGLLTMHVAFSRDQGEKVYVTHLLNQNKDEVWTVIGENNGHLYVCGDARTMARDVHDIVVQVVQEKGNMTQEQALAYVKKMEAQKRYSADVWS
ncbi:NADPH--cytochrome P450 reductase isoform X2 [Homalodisca vitripennis]|uniref:NADPH--cytochrome P450 reductase isoform X2 n=1 Tax=Homalodisca vitripennis TaxID=197043 RepID=UPI001EEBAD67|nr:NADPH--cytochrome P450 reductase isoform X2 [Homalodisca vitripennis]